MRFAHSKLESNYNEYIQREREKTLQSSEHRSVCQEDEVFILHVDKRVGTEVIGEVGAASITACLQACLNSPACAVRVCLSNYRNTWVCINYRVLHNLKDSKQMIS